MNALLTNPFKERLRKGEVQIGLWLSSTTAYMAEIAATSGYDWLLIDGEHAPNTIQDLYHQLQAVAPYASHPVIRPVEGSKPLIKQVLDIGAQTLLIPMVDTADQARQVVSATRYPPYGERGVGASVARAARWGRIENYMAQVNDSLCLLVQVESKTALDNLDEILDVEGIDGVFIDLRIFLRRWATRITPGTRKCSELLKPAFGGSVLRVKLLVFWLWLLIWRSNAWRGERTLSLLALTRCSTAMPWINDWRCLNQAKMGHA